MILKLSYKHIYFLDLVKILKSYNSVFSIKTLIIYFYVKLAIKGKHFK